MIPDDDRQSRRRFLLLLVAAVGGVMGAGFGQLTSDEGEGDDGGTGRNGGNGGNQIDLSVETTGTPNTPAETGTPTEDEPTDTDGSSKTTAGGRTSVGTTTDSDGDTTPIDPRTTTTRDGDTDDSDGFVDTEPTTATDADDGTTRTTTSPEETGGGGTGAGTETGTGRGDGTRSGTDDEGTGTGTGSEDGDGTDDGDPERIAVTTSPIAFTGIMPGDEGSVTVTLSLAGGSARLWVRGDASSFEERGLIEPERDAGDDDQRGELQEHAHVRLRYEDGGLLGDGRVLHEGSLASLADTSFTSLVEGCARPGDHELTLDWRLPADAPNTVQSDAARFALGFLGESCSAEGT